MIASACMGLTLSPHPIHVAESQIIFHFNNTASVCLIGLVDARRKMFNFKALSWIEGAPFLRITGAIDPLSVKKV